MRNAGNCHFVADHVRIDLVRDKVRDKESSILVGPGILMPAEAIAGQARKRLHQGISRASRQAFRLSWTSL